MIWFHNPVERNTGTVSIAGVSLNFVEGIARYDDPLTDAQLAEIAWAGYGISYTPIEPPAVAEDA